MEKIVLPELAKAEVDSALSTYQTYIRRGLTVHGATHVALVGYRSKLQAFLDERQTTRSLASVRGPFTADNLPEEVRATEVDGEALAVAIEEIAADRKVIDTLIAIALNRLDAAHGGRLSALLNGTAAPADYPDIDGDMWPTIKAAYDALSKWVVKRGNKPLRDAESASPTNLPEWAKATSDDLLLMSGKTWSNEADPLNWYAARVLARQPASAFTDDHPDITEEILARALEVYGGSQGETVIRLEAVLFDFVSSVWQTHRPKPVDAVRFELEKVTRNQWVRFVNAVLDAANTLEVDTHSVAREELARILPVAEPPRKVEVTPDVVNVYLHARGLDKSAYDSMDLAIAQANFQAEAKESEAIAKLDAAERKILRVGAIARSQLSGIWSGTDRDALEKISNACAADGVEIESEARESEAVEEVARLRAGLKATAYALKAAEDAAELNDKARVAQQGMIREKDAEIERLTKERDDWQRKAAHEEESGVAAMEALTDLRQELAALRTHAAKLEAMLTVPGVDGPVKTWEPFERRFTSGPFSEWEAAELELGYSINGRPQDIFARANIPGDPLQLRQTPAPEAEVKRWRVERSFCDGGELITKPMTRSDAKKVGAVIGEARFLKLR